MKMIQFLNSVFLENDNVEPRKRANHLRIAITSMLTQISSTNLKDIKEFDKDELETMSICSTSVRNYVNFLRKITDESFISRRETIADEAFVANIVTFTDNFTDMFRTMNESLPVNDILLELQGFIRDGIRLLIIGYDYTQGL